MTRINCISPVELTNKHLMAEYFELPRIVKLAEKWDAMDKPVFIPGSYRLGPGHLKFFYNKFPWLIDRYKSLYYELIIRGFNIDETKYIDNYHGLLRMIKHRQHDWNWEPTEADMFKNRQRIKERLGK
jgi:deoxyribonuclease (pyrimidine dimer)